MTIEDLGPDSPSAAEAARLFDDYRVHNGWPAAPDRTSEWLREQLTSGRLMGWVMSVDGSVAAVVTVAPVPASLALGMTWQVRDLFVSPHFRRRGLARCLMAHVLARASVAEVTRVSIQTEVDNAAALALYRGLGFELVDRLLLLNWTR